MNLVEFAVDEKIAIVTINRPEARNAVDQPTAAALADAFRRFDADDALSVETKYSPGARPFTMKVPSGRMGPADDIVNPKPPVLITRTMPAIGCPSDVIADPVTLVARIGLSAITMSVSSCPTASVMRFA